ncbi:hypothetical protein JHK87_026563 [Glycine soja]|nr:hypothetical protein JHK87_026563 [Glycine soja]
MDEIHVTDPNAEVIALSPTTLMATNRFVCEICNKGFQRNQNLQLHRRGRNPPWKLRQRGSNELMKKRVYVCPEPSCVHHNPARALGDSTGIKKITADNMVKRNGSVTNALEDMLSNLTGRPTRKHVALGNTNVIGEPYFPSSNNTTVSEFNNNYDPKNPLQEHIVPLPFKSTSARQHHCFQSLPRLQNNASASSAHMSATALLQKAAQMGATASNNNNNNSIIINSPTMMQKNFVISGMAGPHHNHNSSSYDHFHHPNPDQSHMQFFHKGQQEMSLIFDSNNNDMRMFGTMFMGIK